MDIEVLKEQAKNIQENLDEISEIIEKAEGDRNGYKTTWVATVLGKLNSANIILKDVRDEDRIYNW